MSKDGYSLRQRSKGTFEIRYQLNGKQVSTTFRADTKTEAAREGRRLARSVEDGRHSTEPRLTLADYLARWLDGARAEVRAITWNSYRNIIEHHLVPRLGKVAMSKLETGHLRQLQAQLADDGKAPSTRRHIHRVLCTALNVAVEDKLIARNPCDGLRRKLPKAAKKEVQTITAEQMRRLVEETAGSRYALAFLITVATGCRRAEVCALRWKHIDREAATVRIEQTLSMVKGELITQPTKNSTPRTVKLPATAAEALRKAYREQAEMGLRLGLRIGPESYVCADAVGKPLTPTALTDHTRRLFDRLGFTLSFHGLRHSHATALLLAREHPKVVQDRLGHSSAKVTLDVYSHVIDQMRDEAADKIDAMMKGKT